MTARPAPSQPTSRCRRPPTIMSTAGLSRARSTPATTTPPRPTGCRTSSSPSASPDGRWPPTLSSPGCARPGASSPRTRPRCCSRRRTTSQLEALSPAAGRGAARAGRRVGASSAGVRVVVAAGRVRAASAQRVAGPAADRAAEPGSVVVDLCAASRGRVGDRRRGAGRQVYASDLDPAAVAVPGATCRRGRHGRVFEGDLFDALPAGLRGAGRRAGRQRALRAARRDALLPPEARDHEPPVALDGGGDGLDVHRRIVASARDWLAPGGSCSSRRASCRLRPRRTPWGPAGSSPASGGTTIWMRRSRSGWPVSAAPPRRRPARTRRGSRGVRARFHTRHGRSNAVAGRRGVATPRFLQRVVERNVPPLVSTVPPATKIAAATRSSHPVDLIARDEPATAAAAMRKGGRKIGSRNAGFTTPMLISRMPVT